jgi:hypothetical protein
MLSAPSAALRADEFLHEAAVYRRSSAPAEPRSVAVRQALGLALVRLGMRVLVVPPEPLARQA